MCTDSLAPQSISSVVDGKRDYACEKRDRPLWVEPLKEVCNPCVLTDSPDVLSMGRRCIDQGYEYTWAAHDSRPFFLMPGRETLTLEAENDMPFLPIDAKPTAAATQPTTPVEHDSTMQDSATKADDSGSDDSGLEMERCLAQRRAPAPSPAEADESNGVELLNAPELDQPGVEEHDGEERYHPQSRRDKVYEATSLRHLLLHDHKNEHCEVCRESAFLRKNRTGDIATSSRSSSLES